MLKLVQSLPYAVDTTPDSETAVEVDLDWPPSGCWPPRCWLDARPISMPSGQLDETGRRLVVGNGYARQREAPSPTSATSSEAAAKLAKEGSGLPSVAATRGLRIATQWPAQQMQRRVSHSVSHLWHNRPYGSERDRTSQECFRPRTRTAEPPAQA